MNTTRRLQWAHLLGILGAILMLLGLAAPSFSHAAPRPAPEGGVTAVVGGCTAAPYGYVCVSVDGKAGTTYVARASVVRGKLDGSLICNYGGRVYIKAPSGKIVWTQAYNRKGCSVGRAWFTFDVNRTFPSGSRVCSRFREYGVQQGGEPCITLRQK